MISIAIVADYFTCFVVWNCCLAAGASLKQLIMPVTATLFLEFVGKKVDVWRNVITFHSRSVGYPAWGRAY